MPTFTPPTIPVSVGDASRYGMWSRYAIEVGQSVVRIGGILVLHPYPSSDELRPLAEGVDFFLGGRTYEVSDLTAAELTAAGFTIGDSLPGGTDLPGFGEGGYGEGGFGL